MLRKFGKRFLWILKLTHASQIWKKKVKVSCCESHSNLYTADEAAVLVTLDNKSTLLFILDNSALKIGNCCWLVLFSVLPACVSKTKKMTKGSQAPSQAGISHTVTFQLLERVFKSVAVCSFMFAAFLVC